MPIEYRVGDVIKAFKRGDIAVLVHGCNCFCKMGAGIAKKIAWEFPSVAWADAKMTIKRDENKLGTIRAVNVPVRRTWACVVNAYTQYYPGASREDIPHDSAAARYGYIESCLCSVRDKFSDSRIGMPKIGCGLAGLEWDKAEVIVNDVFNKQTVYVYTLK